MKKALITILMAILAVTMLTACGNKSVEQDPPVSEEPPVSVEKNKPETEEGQYYEVGKEYILKDDMKVRKGPSTDSDWLKKSELADEDKGKALDDDNAVLSKGTIVKCLEADGYWIRMSSGWICGYDKGRVYILNTEFEEYFEQSKARFYEKAGVDQNSSKKLSGTYAVSGGDSMDSVEFFEDGECAVHYAEAMTPVTDEEGYTNGFYAVSGSKVYINCGGSVYIDVYNMSGKTLQKTSEQIEWMQG
ncbi:MAG: hypothetical protein J5961_03325 [Mogibacterium sp.]|nr:hypothetical protein [Mogibacterium sp.]